MKTTLIKLTDKYILTSDEEIKEGEWRYNFYPRRPGFDAIDKALITQIGTTASKIIAGIEGLPSVDLSPLSEEDQKRVGWVDVENLAEDLLKAHPDFEAEGMSEYQNGRYNGIIEGFIERAFLITRTNMNPFDITIYDVLRIDVDHIIQSLHQPKTWTVETKQEGNSIKVLKVL